MIISKTARLIRGERGQWYEARETEGWKIAKKETKDGVLKGRKKGTKQAGDEELVYYTPAPSLSSVHCLKGERPCEGGAPEGDTKGKGVKKKDKGKKKEG